MFSAFVALLSAFVSVLPCIIAAGLIAFGSGWLMHNVGFKHCGSFEVAAGAQTAFPHHGRPQRRAA